jgi:predicted ATPase/DNA-binding CsgD family transcriptional regulator
MEVRMTSEQSNRKHNLPAPVSSFIGREQELREIGQRLRENRLITLTGTGGTGKTSLALQAAIAELDHFSDGVWLIDLAPLATSELVLETIANVLNLSEASNLSPIEQLGTYLEARHLLLVLDNCEHVIEECARIVASLLARCPCIMLLATSREPLTINGESVLRVPALSFPNEARSLDRARLLQYDALRLFAERGHAAEPSFQLTDDNARIVAEICRHLDGIPLALELAAVRVRGMGVAELSKRLDQRFQLLASGDRAALPRQQTLHAMIDWSHRLLPEPEQVVLRRLGIFVGAFELQAAESICAGAYSSQNGPEIITTETILPHLLQLVNKSMVQFNQESNRYRLLETIRIFSLEMLKEVGETQSLHRQHFAWYLRLAELAAPNFSGPQQEVWFARLEAEHENMRAALVWALDEGEVLEVACFALAIWRFWHVRTFQREGLRWLERIRELDEVTPLPPTLRPRLFNALGVLSHSLRQFDRATSYHTEALQLWRELDDHVGLAQAVFDIGWQQFDEMKLEQARNSARESLVLAQGMDDHQLEAQALLLYALASTEANLVEEAISALEESLIFFREAGDIGNMALAMATLARVEGIRGNDERVKPLLREAVQLLVQQGNFIYVIGPLVALGFMAMRSQEQPEGARSAAQIYGVMTTWTEKLGGTSPWNEGPMQQAIEQLTVMLGADTFAQAFEAGKQMTPADLVRLADHITAPTPQTILPNSALFIPVHERLTTREVEVLRLVATGLTNAQIAHQLSVTSRTVNAHLTAIYRRLGVTSRSGAIRYALDHQLG